MSQSAKYALTTLRGAPLPSWSCACAAVTGPATASPAPRTSADNPASRRLLRNMVPPLLANRQAHIRDRRCPRHGRLLWASAALRRAPVIGALRRLVAVSVWRLGAADGRVTD